MSAHKRCEDCGKCRVIHHEDWCGDCEYRSCERGPDCKDGLSPYEAAGLALYVIEHPHVSETIWPLLDEQTRQWWTNRAKPITDAVRRTL